MKNILARLTVLTVLLALFAISQPGPKRSMHADLKLTDAQQEQFEKITFDMKKKQIELKAKLETSRLELKRLMTADALDKSAVEKKMTEIASQQVAMRMNHINAWSEKNKALNAEQQAIWKKMLHRGNGPMNGPHPGRMMRHQSMDPDMPGRMERRIEKKIIKE